MHLHLQGLVSTLSTLVSTKQHHRFSLDETALNENIKDYHEMWLASVPFRHAVIDNFLTDDDAEFLSDRFPEVTHPVGLDWKKRSKFQYGKQGPGNSDRFDLMDPDFLTALQQFNSWKFLTHLENLTSIPALLPDPYFTGGGMHQTLKGGILDIHTDFNYYEKLQIYRRLNVLLYLTKEWKETYGGRLELWDNPPQSGGRCVKSIPPIFNRLVVFETDKTSFHGHPQEWNGPDGIYRRSIALYFYTSAKLDDQRYDVNTDFQNYVSKDIPEGE